MINAAFRFNKRNCFILMGQILTWILLNSTFLYGGETITSINIVTPEWQGLTNKDGTGLYFELLQMVYEPVGIKVKYEFVPWARAVIYVNSKTNDALLGSYNTVDAYFPEYPIDTEYTVAVYKNGIVDRWLGEKSIENKKVAWVRGYNYHRYLNVKVNFSEVNRSEQGWKMLMEDRIEFFLNSQNAIKKYVKKNDVDLNGIKINTVLVKNIYVRFSKTVKSKRLIEIYDKRMSTLIQRGKIQTLFKKWDSAYPSFPATN